MMINRHFAPSAGEKSLIDGRDRNFFVNLFSGISISEDGSWISSGNGYLPGHHHAIEDAIKNGRVDTRDFGNYLASSTFIHCQNAWSYFGSSINALIHNNSGNAIHFAYYAELHAALSILASEGIYLGDKKVCTITQQGALSSRGSSTHEGSWKYLCGLFENSDFHDRVSTVIAPWGTSWADHNNQMPLLLTPFLVDTLQELTLDLDSFVNDRRLRNLTSYNPIRLMLKDVSLEASWVADFVSQTIKWFEPTEGNSFSVIDDYLFMVGLMLLWEDDASKDWEDWLEKKFLSHSKGKIIVPQIIEYGFDEIRDIKDKLSSRNMYPQTSIVASLESLFFRMMVLMRISTGCAKLVQDESANSSLDHWIGSIEKQCCIDSDLDDKQLLWKDLDEAADDLKEVAKTEASFQDARKSAYIVEEPERALVWSFA